jgi:iron complex transport system ATP-binding protein
MLRLTQASYSVGGADLVAGVALSVSAGEVVGIIGPNGAGKSTLLGLIARELTPTAGRIELMGRRLEDFSLRELATLRSLLPQHPVLRFGFRCLDVVMMGRFPHEESPEQWMPPRRVIWPIVATRP